MSKVANGLYNAIIVQINHFIQQGFILLLKSHSKDILNFTKDLYLK